MTLFGDCSIENGKTPGVVRALDFPEQKVLASLALLTSTDSGVSQENQETGYGVKKIGQGLLKVVQTIESTMMKVRMI